MDRLEEIKKKIKLFGTSPVAKRSIKYFDYKDSDWLISEIERKNMALVVIHEIANNSSTTGYAAELNQTIEKILKIAKIGLAEKK